MSVYVGRGGGGERERGVSVYVGREGGGSVLYLAHSGLQSLNGLVSCEPQRHHHDNALFTGGRAARRGG